jgi:heme/copper-type cytochrome/quinol oxidase subunit 2
LQVGGIKISTPTPTPTNGTSLSNLFSFIGNSTYTVQLLIVGGFIVVLFIAVFMLRKRRK